MPKELRLFVSLSVFLTVLSWAFAYVCHKLGMPKPYSWPYYNAGVGDDFSSFQGRFQYFHTAHFFTFDGPPFMYPAPLAIVYRFLYGLWGSKPHVAYLFWICGALMVFTAAAGFTRALVHKGIVTLSAVIYVVLLVVFSYPLYFVMQRGNMEIYVWFSLLIAVWGYRTHRLNLSAVLLGLAIALKWYPVILLGVYLSEKKYKLIVVSLITAILVTVLSAAMLGPTIAIALHETSHSMGVFVDRYAKGYLDFGYDHSFFAIFKFVTLPLRPNLPVDLSRYMLLAAVTGTLLYFLRLRKLPVVNQWSVLLLLSITLPPVSYDYTLLQTYLCFGLFALYLLDACKAGTKIPTARATIIAFAFAVAPHGYAIYHHNRYCGQVRLLGLAALLYIFIRYPFTDITPSPISRDSSPNLLRNLEST